MDSQVKTLPAADKNAFRELPRSMSNGGRPFPRIDAFEVDGMIEMVAEVPGVPESAINIMIEGDKLTIEVDKAQKNEGKRVHFAERLSGRFQRSMELPFAPEPAKMRAALQNGLLTIRFPRVEQGRVQKIAIGAAPAEARSERSALGANWPDRPVASEPLTLDVRAPATPPRREG